MGLHGVTVVPVMWRRLEMPHQLSGVRIQGDDRAGIEVVAGASFPGEHRVRVAGPPVEEVQLRVVSPGDPRHTAAVCDGVAVLRPCLGTRLAWLRRGIPAPLELSG